MSSSSKHFITCIKQTAMVCLLGIATASAQTAQAPKPQMADDVFKNIQVLHGLSVDQFMGTMGFIAAALSMNCSECHNTLSAATYAEDNPRKQMARKMILMVNALNKTNFAGKREVTCYSCHRASDRPKITPNLAEQYGTPPPDDPDEVEPLETPVPGALSADQVFDKYIAAVGGADRAAKVTSFVGHGTYAGYDTEQDKVQVDVFAQAPSDRTTVVHLSVGDNIRTFDGHTAWTTSAGTLMPVPVLMLTGGDQEGARLDAEVSFPTQIKQMCTGWRSDFPSTSIDDNPVYVVQGINARNTPVKLYFDKKSGLLIRMVRYSDTPIGLNPIEVDYGDYRDVAGVKMPFKVETTWTDGRSTIEFSQIQPNVTIDAAKFAMPAPTTPRQE